MLHIVYVADGYSNSCLFVNTRKLRQSMYTQNNRYDDKGLVIDYILFLQIRRPNRQFICETKLRRINFRRELNLSERLMHFRLYSF